jgi:hypothetical protein
MNKFLMQFSYLLVLNFELVIFMVGGMYGGFYLNKHYPIGANWLVITTPLSLLLCGYLVFRYLVKIIKDEQKKTEQEISDRSDTKQ